MLFKTINHSFDFLIEHNVSSDHSPIITNRTNVSLYVENIESEDKYFNFVEIMISPFPSIVDCKPFSVVITITLPELAVSPSRSISRQMCTVTPDDFSDNTGIQ